MSAMPRSIKIILGLKALFAVVILLLYFNVIHIGDVNLFAQNEPAPATTENTMPTSLTEKPAEVDDGYQEAERPKNARKSFLDELFSSPEINTEGMQKDEVGKYLTMLDRKKKQVEERISLIQAREARLIDIERSIDSKLRRLDEEKRFFADTIQKEKTMSDERSAQLVEFYKKMAPKAAAPVFEKLDKDLVVHLFNKLPQKQITSILALMPPETSVKLTEYYGRLRSGREYEMLREINKSLTDEFQTCKGM